jgi:signal transduction histidine kinase
MPSIEVKDSGVGMEPEFINKKLFKPFETTKKKGLGIGLYQSRDQLERMGGRFKVTSKLGQGTGFKVFFPLGERSSR